MHRIDGPGATIEGRFTEGDPITGVPATTVTGDWLNALQDEIVNVIEGAGAALDKEDDTQLRDAIATLIDGAIAEIPPPPPVFFTGDVRMTLRSSAAPGWVICDDGTIGPAGSGATTRADDDCEDLFTLLWTNVLDAHAPVSGGRGASAAADWAADKTIGLTKMLGRSLAVAGAGADLTSRDLGEALGAETHTLTVGEMPEHSHSEVRPTSGGNQGGGGGAAHNVSTTTTGTAGDDQPHNNMQPTAFLTAEIKL